MYLFVNFILFLWGRGVGTATRALPCGMQLTQAIRDLSAWHRLFLCRYSDPWLNRMTECLSHDQYQVTISCPRSLLFNCENLIKRTLLEGASFYYSVVSRIQYWSTKSTYDWLDGVYSMQIWYFLQYFEISHYHNIKSVVVNGKTGQSTVEWKNLGRLWLAKYRTSGRFYMLQLISVDSL